MRMITTGTPAQRSYHASPEPTSSCTAQTSDGGTCGRPGVASAPFPACVEHLLAAYRFVNDRITDEAIDVPAQVNAFAECERTAGSRAWPETMNGWPSVVYYAAIGHHIKIGTTKRLVYRMRWYPPSARLLAVEPGARAVERHRHDQFAHLRSARAEWFSPGPDLVQHMAELRAVGLPRGPRPIE